MAVYYKWENPKLDIWSYASLSVGYFFFIAVNITM